MKKSIYLIVISVFFCFCSQAATVKKTAKLPVKTTKVEKVAPATKANSVYSRLVTINVQDTSTQPGKTKILAYKNGKKLSDKEAKELYHQLSKEQARFDQEMDHFWHQSIKQMREMSAFMHQQVKSVFDNQD